MSAPAGGAAPTALQPGGPPVLLTEYAPNDTTPVTLINDSQTRAYFGSDGSVSPNNGVPLDGGTSTQWSTGGQLWACADPDGSEPALVRATTAIGDWQPSPYTVGLTVAEQLFATGIPTALVETEIVSAQPLTPSGASSFFTIDVSKYASITIYVASSDAQPIYLGWEQTAPDNTMVDSDGFFIHGQTVRLAVTGTKFTLGNQTATGQTATVTIVGSSRTIPGRTSALVDADMGDNWSYTWSAGNPIGVQTLTQFDFSCQMEGLVYATFTATSGLSGRFEVFWPGLPSGQLGSRAPIILADTAADMKAMASQTLYVNKPIALPHGGGWAIQFRSQTTASTAQSVTARFLRP